MQKIRKFLEALSEKNLGQMHIQTNQQTLGVKDAVKRFDLNCFLDFGIQKLLTWCLQYQVGLDFFLLKHKLQLQMESFHYLILSKNKNK